MTFNHLRSRGVNARPEDSNSDYVWGADAIGRVIGRNPRQANHLLAKGEIKCAQRKGGRWVANVAALRKEFGE